MAFTFAIGDTVGHNGCNWSAGKQQRLFVVMRKSAPQVSPDAERNVYIVRAIDESGSFQSVNPVLFEVFEEELRAYP